MHRQLVRLVAAGIAAIMATIYYLIGAGLLVVVEQEADDPSMLVFGVAAGSLFLLGAILLLVRDRRILWILGAVLQLLVAWAYVSVAAQRVPAFEGWGLTLRLLQVPLLAALVWLALRRGAAGRALGA